MYLHAQSEDYLRNKLFEPCVFLVEKEKGNGVKVGQRSDSMGLRAASFFDVEFDSECCDIVLNVVVPFSDVSIPLENRLGDEVRGQEVLLTHMGKARLLEAASCAGLLRKTLDKILLHVTETKQFDQSLVHLGYTRHLLVELCRRIYALESMVFLTAGLIDIGEFKDTSVETILCEVS